MRSHGRGRCASAPGSRSSTSRNDRLMRSPSMTRLGGNAAATIAAASSISASVTSSDGARRSAVGVTALSTRPLSRHRCATALASRPGDELGRDEQARAAHVGDPLDLLQALDQVRARARRARDVAAFHHVERGERGAGGERLAAEGRGVVAGSERGRDVGPCPAGADRHAVAERLRHRDDVGPDARRARTPNHLPVRPSPHCTSSMIEQRLALVAQAAHGAEVLGRRRHDAAFALHGLEHHRRDAVVDRRGSSASRSSNATWRKPVGKRLEGLLLLGLTGRRERCERAAVERAVRADHVVAITPAVSCPNRRASLIAHSLASAPEFAKNTRPPPPSKASRPPATWGCTSL